jgi:hypothetical protein
MLRRFKLNISALALALLVGATLHAQVTMAVKTAPSGQSGSYTTSSTTLVPVDSTNLSYTVTIPSGYNLLINAVANAASPTDEEVWIALVDGSTTLVSNIVDTTPTFEPCALTWVVAGDGASHTIKLEWAGASSKITAVMLYSNTASGNMLTPAMTFLLAPSN